MHPHSRSIDLLSAALVDRNALQIAGAPGSGRSGTRWHGPTTSSGDCSRWRMSNASGTTGKRRKHVRVLCWNTARRVIRATFRALPLASRWSEIETLPGAALSIAPGPKR